MDGRGRALDNVFIERLWRSVKQEYVYLNPCETGQELWCGLNGYFRFYNTLRPHQSLNNLPPGARYHPMTGAA
jgi:putative transposase